MRCAGGATDTMNAISASDMLRFIGGYIGGSIPLCSNQERILPILVECCQLQLLSNNYKTTTEAKRAFRDFENGCRYASFNDEDMNDALSKRARDTIDKFIKSPRCPQSLISLLGITREELEPRRSKRKVSRLSDNETTTEMPTTVVATKIVKNDDDDEIFVPHFLVSEFDRDVVDFGYPKWILSLNLYYILECEREYELLDACLMFGVKTTRELILRGWDNGRRVLTSYCSKGENQPLLDEEDELSTFLTTMTFGHHMEILRRVNFRKKLRI